MEFVESVLAATAVRPRGESGVPWRPVARFHLGPQGSPEFDELNGTPHYWFDLLVESPHPEQLSWADYLFHKPGRGLAGFSDDPTTNFAETLRTSGDSEVRVKVGVKGERFVETTPLSAMLAAGHERDMTPAVREAIDRIKATP